MAKKDNKKGFLKYYKPSLKMAKLIKIWAIIFIAIMVVRLLVLNIISKVIHIIRDTVTANPNGYLNDLFPKADTWGNKFDEHWLFDIDSFLTYSLIITSILVGVYILLILLRHRNGEHAPFINDIEAYRLKRLILETTDTTSRKTYKDNNDKKRKYSKNEIKVNKHIRNCEVEIHTYNKHNIKELPPIKTYRVAFKRIRNNKANGMMFNRIKNIHESLNAEIDASFSVLDNYSHYYTSSVEKQLEKPKQSLFVKWKKRWEKDEDVEEKDEMQRDFTYPLTLYEDRTEEIESKKLKADIEAEELQEAITHHLVSKGIYADKAERFVANASADFKYTLPPNTKKVINTQELETTLDTTLDVEGSMVKLRGRKVIITVPLEDIIPIDIKTMIESVHENGEVKNPTHTILGIQTSGDILNAPISSYPHALVAGATGSGKSVFINSGLLVMMAFARPDEVKVIIIDPKGNEFGEYKGLPFMLTDPIIDLSESKVALEYLAMEMDYRFQLFQKYGGLKDIDKFNQAIDEGEIEGVEKLPRIILMIDEFADLMEQYKAEVQGSIKRLGAKARAAGVHMILATQTPRREFIDGAIKANVPTKIVLMVTSTTESMVALGRPGAEELRKHGDFYASIGGGKLQRGQGSYVEDKEIKRIFKYLRENYPKPDLINIEEKLEEVQLKFRKVLAENTGKNPDDIEIESENTNKSNVIAEQAKTVSRRSEEERQKAKEQHEKTMAKIAENEKEGKKGSTTVKIDTSLFSHKARNESRREKGLEELKPKSGIIPSSSSKSKRKKRSSKEETENTRNESKQVDKESENTIQSNVQQNNNLEKQSDSTPKKVKKSNTTSNAGVKPLNKRRINTTVKKATTRTSGSPLARRRR